MNAPKPEPPLTPTMPDSPSLPVSSAPVPPRSPQDANGPKPTVIRNSFLALGAGCITGTVVGAYKQLPPGPTAAGMGSMWGALGFTYFLSRAQLSKYLAEADTPKPDPVPLAPLGQRHKFPRPAPMPPAELRDRHTLLASLGAGAITGSLSTLMAGGGRRLVLPGTLVAATCAGLGQAAYTWARHARQDVLLWKYQASGVAHEALEARAKAETAAAAAAPSFVASVKAQVRDVLVNTKWLPVRMLTDDEYLRSLQGQVAQVEGEVAKYERVMDKLKERIRKLEKEQGQGTTGQ